MPHVTTAKEFQLKVGDNLGAGADLFGRLRDAGINVLASCCYQIGDAASLSFVAEEFDRAHDLLESQGLEHEMVEVLLVELDHRSGAFADLLQKIASLGVQARSAYVTPTTTATGLAVIKTDNNEKVLEELNRPTEPPT